MNLELARCEDDSLWDGFVERSPQGSIFSSSTFFAALGLEVHRFLVLSNEQVLAAVPILLEGDLPISAPYIFTLYQGLMFSPDLDLQPPHSGVPLKLSVTNFLLENLSALYKRISICTHPSLTDLRSFLWFNYHAPDRGIFTVDVRFTATLDLSGFSQEKYTKQIRINRRRDAARALSKGFHTALSSDFAVLDSLHDMTFARQGKSRSEAEVATMQAIAKAAQKYGWGYCMVAKDQNDNVGAASLVLFDRKSAYWLIGANHPDLRQTGASTLLMMETIKEAAGRGLKWFDFVGINSPDRGDYKVSFNSTPSAYYVLSWQKSERASLS